MTNDHKKLQESKPDNAILRREINYLTFSGGGWRPLHAQGIIEVLREEGILKNVVAASFCSGSCVIAIFLLSGYDSEQTMRFLEKHILDDKYTSPFYFIPEHIASEKTPYYNHEKQDGFLKRMTKRLANVGIFSYLVMKNVVDAVRSKGLFHVKSMEELLWQILQNSPTLPDHLKKRDLTFLELHHYKAEFQAKYPHLPFIDPYITVSEKSSEGYKVKYHSYETTPNEPILKAASASMTFPWLFRQKEKGLVDGGVVDISARAAFDKKEMNMRTQAIYFAPSQNDIERWRDNRKNTKLSSTMMLLMKLSGVEKYWKSQEEAHQMGANALRTFYINSSLISTFSPKGLTKEKFHKMCQDAKTQTKEYLKLYFFDTICPHAPLDKISPELKGYFI